MKRVIFLILLTTIFACKEDTNFNNAVTKDNGQSNTSKKLEHFLSIADSLRVKANVPGVGIVLVNDNKVIYTGGLGYRDVEKKLPVTENTNFLIGSTTKAFTGTLIAKLVSKGQLDWKAPIKTYIPELELRNTYITNHITLTDALSHSTGLGRYDHLWKNTDFTREQTLDVIKTIPYVAPFRNSYGYNNWMYMLSGLTAERVTGNTWEELIEEEILSPMNMTNTFTTDEEFLNSKERAIGYKRDGKTIETYIKLQSIAPAGAISSTPKDLSKWLLMFVDNGKYNGKKILTDKEYSYIIQPQSNTGFRPPNQFWYYNAGWGGYYADGKINLGHDGSIEGYNAWASIKPNDSFGVFILTNQISNYKNIIAGYAENIFLRNDYTKDLEQEEQLIATYAIVKLREILLNDGVSEAKKYIQKINHTHLENSMNNLGYELMGMKKMSEAEFIFSLNTIYHEGSANVFDSLGEYYYNSNDFESAILNYKKSLDLDPKNSNAKDMITKMEASL